MDETWRRRVEAELHRAERAREDGQEAKARVCARRAAGWSLQPYYHERTGFVPPANALELLRWFQTDEAAPLHLRHAAQRLTIRVTVGFRLPHVEDPLEDARRIVEAYTQRA